MARKTYGDLIEEMATNLRVRHGMMAFYVAQEVLKRICEVEGVITIVATGEETWGRLLVAETPGYQAEKERTETLVASVRRITDGDARE